MLKGAQRLQSFDSTTDQGLRSMHASYHYLLIGSRLKRRVKGRSDVNMYESQRWMYSLYDVGKKIRVQPKTFLGRIITTLPVDKNLV
jgi:hypothetical protein